MRRDAAMLGADPLRAYGAPPMTRTSTTSYRRLAKYNASQNKHQFFRDVIHRDVIHGKQK